MSNYTKEIQNLVNSALNELEQDIVLASWPMRQWRTTTILFVG